MTAVARDTAGNLTMSAPVSVIFDNVAVMPLGNSYTSGYISDTSPNNEDGGYRRYLWEKLQANGILNADLVGSVMSGIPGMDRDDEGHGGWRVDEVDASAAGSLAAAQPDIVLLLVGTNDINEGYTPAVSLNRLGTLLDHIHSLRPSAKIVLSNLPGTRANADPNFGNVTPQNVATFNNALPSMVSSRAGQGWNISLVDVHSTVDSNEQLERLRFRVSLLPERRRVQQVRRRPLVLRSFSWSLGHVRAQRADRGSRLRQSRPRKSISRGTLDRPCQRHWLPNLPQR